MRAIPLFLCVVAACGGSLSTELDGGGDASNGDAAIFEGGSTDSGLLFPDAAPVQDASTVDASRCDMLEAQARALQPAAQKCCSTCNVQQCTQLVPGVCCDVRVTDPTSPDVMAFEAAVKAHAATCPCRISCPVTPPAACDPSTNECR